MKPVLIVYLVLSQPLDKHGLLRIGKARLEGAFTNRRSARRYARNSESRTRCAWIVTMEVET